MCGPLTNKPARRGSVDEETAPTQVIICGMVRSGTSVNTALLHFAGMELGNDPGLVKPSSLNARGSYENASFKQITGKVLSANMGNYSHPVVITAEWVASDKGQEYVNSARACIAEQFASTPFRGFKYGVASLTIPFWKEVWPEAKYVICFRNPLEVAASLNRHMRLGTAKGLALWQAYLELAVRHIPPAARIYSFYDDLIGDPVAHVKGIAAGLSLPVKDEPLWEGRAREFAEPDLKHHAYSIEDVREQCPAEIVGLYEAMMAGEPLPKGLSQWSDAQLLSAARRNPWS